MAERTHLFPFRTQKLSFLAPKVLVGTLTGRIGHRHFSITTRVTLGPFFCARFALLGETRYKGASCALAGVRLGHVPLCTLPSPELPGSGAICGPSPRFNGILFRSVEGNAYKGRTIPQSCCACQLPLHKGASEKRLAIRFLLHKGAAFKPPLFGKGEVARSAGRDKPWVYPFQSGNAA